MNQKESTTSANASRQSNESSELEVVAKRQSLHSDVGSRRYVYLATCGKGWGCLNVFGNVFVYLVTRSRRG